MKDNLLNPPDQSSSRQGCLIPAGRCHQRVATEQIRKSKAAIFAEARGGFARRDRMLRLALNEAEALAWETRYPHLVFPALATEKVQDLARWSEHQRLVREADPTIELAA